MQAKSSKTFCGHSVDCTKLQCLNTKRRKLKLGEKLTQTKDLLKILHEYEVNISFLNNHANIMILLKRRAIRLQCPKKYTYASKGFFQDVVSKWTIEPNFDQTFLTERFKTLVFSLSADKWLRQKQLITSKSTGETKNKYYEIEALT